MAKAGRSDTEKDNTGTDAKQQDMARQKRCYDPGWNDETIRRGNDRYSELAKGTKEVREIEGRREKKGASIVIESIGRVWPTRLSSWTHGAKRQWRKSPGLQSRDARTGGCKTRASGRETETETEREKEREREWRERVEGMNTDPMHPWPDHGCSGL